MATSGSTLFSRNRDQLITDALLLAGVIDEDETPSSSLMDKSAVALNSMVKHWQGTGLYIWVMSEATLFLQSSQSRYTLGTGSTDHAASTFTETELSADAISGATTITVDSITGIAASDQIGIQVDDGTIHWTTVSGAPSGSTVTLATGLDDTASEGALVLAYTSNIVRPLEIVSARRYNFISGVDTPIAIEGREEYFDLPTKTGSGTPNVLYYDRRGGANATGYLYFWQPQGTPTDAIKFTWKRPIESFTTAADDADFPQEWFETLTYNLAARLCVSYGYTQRLALIAPLAKQNLDEMRWNERELETIEFRPAMR
jgi:hypothetical protein